MSAVLATWRDRALGMLALVALLSACERSNDSPGRPSQTRLSSRAAPSTAPRRLGVFRSLKDCRVSHNGPFVDLGSADSVARRAFRFGPFAYLQQSQEGGASHTRYLQRRVHYDVWLSEPLSKPRLTLRARAGLSRAVTATLDNRRLGTLRPSANNYENLVFHGIPGTLAPGRHRITLQWSGRGGSSDRPYGSAQWFHLGTGSAQWGEERRPPVANALWSDVVLDEVPHTSLVLEHATEIACPVRIAEASSMELSVGMWGTGEGIARVSVLTEDGSTQPLAEKRIKGGPDARWASLSVDLSSWRDKRIHLQLSAQRLAGQGLVAFGEPVLLGTNRRAEPQRASVVVVVVAAGLHRELLPPFPGAHLSALQRLIDEGTRFTNYRVPTTRAGGVVASLLTGASPLQHGLDRRHAKLDPRIPTLATELLGKSGESAFLTSVPHTRDAFGFGGGFHRFEQYSPVKDIPAIEPLTQGSRWLQRRHETEPDPPRLLLLHVRGAHPPWDLSREQIQKLPPDDYHGILEARRGGLILSEIRHRRRRSSRRLPTSEWTRLRALQAEALTEQDNALGKLFASLDALSLWDSALIVFTGDVASGEPPEAPFGDGGSLEEQLLNVPLWVKFPGSRPIEESDAAVDTMDLAHTIAAALGIELPGAQAHSNLSQVAAGLGPLAERPRMATTDQSYSLRWGNDILYGDNPDTPHLCRLDIDPRCSVDLLEEQPLVAEAMWLKAYLAQRRGREAAAETGAPPAVLDRSTAAALKVWGE